MYQQDRAVTPVISTILMVAIVVVLAATASVFFLDVAGSITEPAPTVGDTTSVFEAGGDLDQQVVSITYIAGEDVTLSELEMIVRASGDHMDNTQVRLVNLPPSLSTFDANSYEGNGNLASGYGVSDGVLFDDSTTWTAGKNIKFRIPVGAADFRTPPNNTGPEADKLEVVIVHTPSRAIISETTFRP
jgi:flagellin-like protein